MISLVISLSFESRGVEDTARSLVTQIFQEQLGTRAAKCVRVRITENLGGGYYKAIVTLDNGNDIRILIELKGSMVYVTVPPER